VKKLNGEGAFRCMRWEKTPIDAGDVRGLAERYGVDLLSAAIMTRRGLTEPHELKYLLEDDVRYLHNPFLFDEMEDAVDRIMTARTEGERVLVFGDRDVDGITGIALLVRTLEELELEVEWRLPLGDNPYGLTMEEVDRFAERDGTLIVTVDCGITQAAEIEHARSYGIDTIVLDHHNAPEQLPPAVAIVNPKMPDTSYPFSGLCGCALAAKLRWAVFFATTELYKQPVVLLHARPGNETIVVEAVKLVNLVEVDRISETVVPGMVAIESTRLYSFLQGQHILVYDGELEGRLLARAFGDGVEIQFADLAPEIWKLFPALQGRSLLKLRDSSRMAVYAGAVPEEVDVLVSMFELFVTRNHSRLGPGYEHYLDLAALGTIGDMMPLVNENRIVVRKGLAALSSTINPGLRELLARQGLLGQHIRARDVAWSISPVINASGRMGEPDKAVELLLTDDEELAGARAEEIISLNKRRKKIGEAAWDRLLPRARESLEEHQGRFIVVSDDQVHRGITGILAGRLSRLFNVPAAVIAELETQGVGSVRSQRGLGVTEFLSNFDDILAHWGGHDAAGGFSVAAERIPELRERISAFAPQIVLEEEAEPTITVDAEVPHRYMTRELEQIVQRFAPFGQDHPPLSFLCRAVRIVEAQPIGKQQQPHLRLLLDTGSHKWPAVYWNGADSLERDFAAGDRVDVVFELGKNTYQGTQTLQLVLLDVRRS